MSGAYEDIGSEVGIITTSTGKITGNTVDYTPGTEFLISTQINSAHQHRAWVYESGGALYLIDRFGQPIQNLNVAIAKIVRSGKKNTLSSPIAQIKTTDFPDIQNRFTTNNVLDASAVEYSEDWSANRGPNNKPYGFGCGFEVENGFGPDGAVTYKTFYSKNPYVIGLKGNWRPQTEYLYLTNRTNSNNGIRFGGVYEEFENFWAFNGNSEPSFYEDKNNRWVWSTTIETQNPDGIALESKDPLDRFYSQLLGYGNSQVIASVFNSPMKNSVNLNFEDLDLNEECNLPHVEFNGDVDISENYAHTGNSISFKVWAVRKGDRRLCWVGGIK